MMTIEETIQAAAKKLAALRKSKVSDPNLRGHSISKIAAHMASRGNHPLTMQKIRAAKMEKAASTHRTIMKAKKRMLDRLKRNRLL